MTSDLEAFGSGLCGATGSFARLSLDTKLSNASPELVKPRKHMNMCAVAVIKLEQCWNATKNQSVENAGVAFVKGANKRNESFKK